MDLKKLTRYNIEQGKENGEEHPLGSWVKYPDVAILNHCELRGWEYGNLSMNQVVELPLFYEAKVAVDLKKLDRYSWVGGPKKGFRGHWIKYEDLVICLKGRYSMESRFFEVLDDCGTNCGRAYFVGAIVGDCFCPIKNCGKPIRMNKPVSDDYFFGQCKCGFYAQAKIELDKSGRCGKWVIQNFAEGT